MSKEVFFTEEGLKKIKEELKELKEVKRPIIIESLKEARALGDLSENAEYDSARDEQAIIEGKISELERIVEHAKLIEGISTSSVGLGNKVKIEYINDSETEEYIIVGSKEADPFENKISNESPLATAIMKKKKNDIVEVESPNGKYKVKIVDIT